MMPPRLSGELYLQGSGQRGTASRDGACHPCPAACLHPGASAERCIHASACGLQACMTLQDFTHYHLLTPCLPVAGCPCRCVHCHWVDDHRPHVDWPFRVPVPGVGLCSGCHSGSHAPQRGCLLWLFPGQPVSQLEPQPGGYEPGSCWSNCRGSHSGVGLWVTLVPAGSHSRMPASIRHAEEPPCAAPISNSCCAACGMPVSSAHSVWLAVAMYGPKPSCLHQQLRRATFSQASFVLPVGVCSQRQVQSV